MATPRSPAKRARTESENEEPLLRPENFSEEDVGKALTDRASVRPLDPEMAGPGFQLAGVDHIIRLASETIRLNVAGKRFFNQLTAPNHSHFMVVGASGTGKTLFGEGLKTFANLYEAGRLAFYEVSDREDNFSDIFTSARKLQPSIIYIDPGEFVLGSEVHARALEKELGSLEKQDQIFVFCTTQLANNIPRDLQTAWRLGQTLDLTIHDDQARQAVFLQHVGTWGGITQGVVDYVLGITHQWTGGKIAALCKHAGEAAIRRTYPQLVLPKGIVEPEQIQTLQMVVGDFRTASVKMV